MLNNFRDEQDALAQKLAAIEKKIIVGGENLLEKAEEQEKLLEESAVELEERKLKEGKLRKALEEKEVQFCNVFSSRIEFLDFVWRWWITKFKGVIESLIRITFLKYYFL